MSVEQCNVQIFQKISILPHRKYYIYWGGGGLSRTKTFKEMYHAYLDFQEGWREDIFWKYPLIVKLMGPHEIQAKQVIH